MKRTFIVEKVKRLENAGHPINFVTLADYNKPGIKMRFFYSPNKVFFIDGFKRKYLRENAKEDGMLTPKKMIIPKSANVEVSFSGAVQEHYQVRPFSWMDGMNPIYDKVSEETLSEEEFLKIVNNGFSESNTETLKVEIEIGEITYVTAKNQKDYKRLSEYYKKLERY